MSEQAKDKPRVEQMDCLMTFTVIVKAHVDKPGMDRNLGDVKTAIIVNTLNLFKKIFTPLQKMMTIEVLPIDIKTNDIREQILQRDQKIVLSNN